MKEDSEKVPQSPEQIADHLQVTYVPTYLLTSGCRLPASSMSTTCDALPRKPLCATSACCADSDWSWCARKN